MALAEAGGNGNGGGGGEDKSLYTFCGTKGPVVLTSSGATTFSHTTGVAEYFYIPLNLKSPPLQINESCNGTLFKVYGNSFWAYDPDPAFTANTTLSVAEVAYSADNGETSVNVTVPEGVVTIEPSVVALDNPGAGTAVSGVIINPEGLAPGLYSITIQAQTKSPLGRGLGVGTGFLSFSLLVSEPVLEDTLPPDVTVVSPSMGYQAKLGETVSFLASAIDPYEDGAGTGIIAMNGEVKSAGGSFTAPLALSVAPRLPVAAGVEVAATSSLALNKVGTYAVTFTAEDDADHIGVGVSSFTVAMDVGFLQPITLNKVLKSGQTLPIKWAFTDYAGNLLSPDGSVQACVEPGHVCYSAGTGSGSIGWTLDASGNVTQYLVTHRVGAANSYRVDISVGDVDGNRVIQGSYPFTVGK
jgi:hypothetical protein